ncbi:cytidine deaminase [candidate division KSB1 bacterium]|nr:cytidine deaminase [candidate division KSB1 bacterium]NIR70358.1 cytidine deaminase [candidate division KSB1 bacterium]NIS24482.1 cytidine deaminase [candidate division KSB1 bacterium]NIT71410.1 cytidine deaminase [candidate division KSB1 bacterium]NIU23545.1 cytidine deaminase [candidate division KSB1 bacterium]
MLQQARKAKTHSFSPYSNFAVGAALETKSGKIYTGCNIESSSYGLTICAERVAMFKAISEGESQFSRIAVCTDTDEFCPPCGACRQVLVDFAPNIKVLLLNSKNEVKETTIAALLPEAFNKDFLNNR